MKTVAHQERAAAAAGAPQPAARMLASLSGTPAFEFMSHQEEAAIRASHEEQERERAAARKASSKAAGAAGAARARAKAAGGAATAAGAVTAGGAPRLTVTRDIVERLRRKRTALPAWGAADPPAAAGWATAASPPQSAAPHSAAPHSAAPHSAAHPQPHSAAWTAALAFGTAKRSSPFGASAAHPAAFASGDTFAAHRPKVGSVTGLPTEEARAALPSTGPSSMSSRLHDLRARIVASKEERHAIVAQLTAGPKPNEPPYVPLADGPRPSDSARRLRARKRRPPTPAEAARKEELERAFAPESRGGQGAGGGEGAIAAGRVLVVLCEQPSSEEGLWRQRAAHAPAHLGAEMRVAAMSAGEAGSPALAAERALEAAAAEGAHLLWLGPRARLSGAVAWESLLRDGVVVVAAQGEAVFVPAGRVGGVRRVLRIRDERASDPAPWAGSRLDVAAAAARARTTAGPAGPMPPPAARGRRHPPPPPPPAIPHTTSALLFDAHFVRMTADLGLPVTTTGAALQARLLPQGTGSRPAAQAHPPPPPIQPAPASRRPLPPPAAVTDAVRSILGAKQPPPLPPRARQPTQLR
jgi:hypothetical protein